MNLPPELEDAMARIDTAKEDYLSLQREMDNFLYKYVKGMIRGFDPKTGNFVVRLRRPKDSIVSGMPKVLAVQIMESLRSALDYVVFELSVRNNPALTKNHTQFVIADDEGTFVKQSKRMLRYLKDEERAFVERLQPYRGNFLLGVMRDVTNKSKHRRLLSVRDSSSMDIVFAEMTKKDQYKDWWTYPQDKGSAIFARPKKLRVVLMEEYDAMAILRAMLNHTSDVIAAFYRYLSEGQCFPTVSR